VSAFPWPILIPLTGGCLVYLLPRRLSAAVGVTLAVLAGLSSGILAWQVWDEGPLMYRVGGWGAPLGIDLHADGLAATMLVMTAVVMAISSVYALGYFSGADDSPGWSRRDSFWPLWLFMWAALNALFLSGDVFNIYVTLELLTLPAIALIVLAGDRQALLASMRYLLAAFLGSIAYLLGVAFLYAEHDTLDIALLGERVEATPAAWMALALITAGLLLKAALFPLHFWLPRAHASAPAPVSAALSALVVKASFYLLLRFWLQVFPEALTPPVYQLVGALGAGAVIWGSVQALRQRHLKPLIAYSTIAQIGYLLLVFPLVTAAGADAEAVASAWRGAIYLALAHACAKAAMFLASGNAIHAIGSDALRDLGGVSSRMRATMFAFGIAGISLMGLPPSGGFIGKWLMLTAAISNGQWWWAVVILVGGLLAAGYVFLVLGYSLIQRVGEPIVTLEPVPRTMLVTPLVLAVLSMLLGFRAVEAFALIDMGRPV
jgi:multicomponent Na+:H+ antiporter subunit D